MMPYNVLPVNALGLIQVEIVYWLSPVGTGGNGDPVSISPTPSSNNAPPAPSWPVASYWASPLGVRSFE